MKKVLLYIFLILFLSSIFAICLGNQVYAATPKLVSKLESAFNNIESWILKLSTPAAAVAVGTGIFMKNLVLEMKKELEQERK